MGASPSLLYLFFPRSPHACYYYDTLQYVTQKRKEDERQKLLNQASIPKPSADLMGNTRATCAYTLIVCKKGRNVQRDASAYIVCVRAYCGFSDKRVRCNSPARLFIELQCAVCSVQYIRRSTRVGPNDDWFGH